MGTWENLAQTIAFMLATIAFSAIALWLAERFSR